jgi:hypothetical protein
MAYHLRLGLGFRIFGLGLKLVTLRPMLFWPKTFGLGHKTLGLKPRTFGSWLKTFDLRYLALTSILIDIIILDISFGLQNFSVILKSFV